MNSRSSCSSQVPQFISRGLKIKEITMSCGSTGPDGRTIFCNGCYEYYIKKYPHGWRYHPGDICEHGVYHYPDRDCWCWKCEEGI